MNDDNFKKTDSGSWDDHKENNQNGTDDKDMSIADRFITAMFLPNEYESLLKLKMSKTVTYFLILILLASVIQYAIPVLGAIAGFGGVRSYIINELPDFSLENGEFRVSERIEEDNGDAGIYILVDTDTESFTEDDVPKEMLQAMLVSRTNMIMYNNLTGINGLVQNQPFSAYGNIKMNNETVAGLAPLIYVSMAFIFVLLYIVSLIRFLFTGFMYSLIMLLISKILMSDMTYGKIYETALFAQSVGILVSAVAVCLSSDIIIMTGNAFGVLVTMLIMNRVLFGYAGKPIDY